MKTLLALVFSLLTLPAQAHILLATPYGVTGPTGIALGTATMATAVSDSYNWITNTACITYAFGTATFSGGIDNGFTQLSGAPTVTNCLNLNTGFWSATVNGGSQVILANSSGTLTGTNLTAAIAVYTGPFVALRDAADYFAMGTFLPGTQPDLWGAGDL